MNTPEPATAKPLLPADGSARTTATAHYKGYYWRAYCYLQGQDFETQAKTHGSAKQAVDELVQRVMAGTGATKIGVRRLSPKQYELTVPNDQAQRLAANNPDV